MKKDLQTVNKQARQMLQVPGPVSSCDHRERLMQAPVTALPQPSWTPVLMRRKQTWGPPGVGLLPGDDMVTGTTASDVLAMDLNCIRGNG